VEDPEAVAAGSAAVAPHFTARRRAAAFEALRQGIFAVLLGEDFMAMRPRRVTTVAVMAVTTGTIIITVTTMLLSALVAGDGAGVGLIGAGLMATTTILLMATDIPMLRRPTTTLVASKSMMAGS
jgi:hypothetical protein